VKALQQILEWLGFSTPFVYAAGTYDFFHYLDKQASPKAKKAISGWLSRLNDLPHFFGPRLA
jgi:hypothetical protein